MDGQPFKQAFQLQSPTTLSHPSPRSFLDVRVPEEQNISQSLGACCWERKKTSGLLKVAVLLETTLDAIEQAAFVSGLCFSVDHVRGQDWTWNKKIYEKTALQRADFSW